MNKVFRVIWNASTQSWVAVSEISRIKGKTKSSSEGQISLSTKSVISAALTLLLASSNSIAVKKETNFGDGSTAISSGTAIGANANAGETSVSLGYTSKAKGQAGVAIGTYAESNGTAAIAIGSAQSYQYRTNATGIHSIAIGEAKALKTHSIAIGRGANSSNEGSIALGTYSQTREVNTTNAIHYQSLDDQGNLFNSKFSGTARNSSNGAYEAAGVVSIGQEGQERQLINVAPGRITADSTDAINGSQLYQVAQNTGFNIKENGASKSRINNNGVVDFKKGNYVTATVTDGNNSSDIKFDVVTQTITSGATGVASVSGAEGLATAKNVSDAINHALAKAGGNITLKANSEAGGQLINRGDAIDIKQGKNINVTRSGSAITINTVDNPNFTNVNVASNLSVNGTASTSNLSVANNSTLKNVTLSAGSTFNAGNNKLTNVEDGTASKDAVNKGQLDHVNSTLDTKLNNINSSLSTNIANLASNLATLNNKGLSFNADSGSTTRKLGETIEIKGGNKNINTTIENNTLKINISDSPEFTTLNTTGNAKIGGDLAINGTTTAKDLNVTNNTTLRNVTLSSGSIFDGGNNKLTNVADGANSKDAVNKGQLDKVNDDLKANISNLSTNLDKGMNFTGNTGSTNQKAGDTLQIVGDDKNISTNVNKGKVEIKFSDNPTFTTLNTTGDATVGGNLIVNGTATAKDLNVTNNTTLKNVTLSSDSTFDAGSNKLTNVLNGTNPNDAVNKSQLDDVNSTLDNKLNNLNASFNTNLSNLESNLSTLNDKGLSFNADSGNTTRKLGETIEIKGGNKNINTTIENNTLKINISDSPEFTTLNTIGNAKIGGDLAINGTTTAKDLNVTNNTTLRNVTLSSGSIFDGGNNKLTNVADGANSKDAVNKGQLDKVNDDLKANISNLSTNLDKGMNFTGNTGSTNQKAGDTLQIVGDDKNISTNVNKGKVEIKFSDNPTFTTLNTTGDATVGGNLIVNGTATAKDLNVTNNTTLKNVTLSSGSTFDAGNNKLTNVLNGTNPNDAVNKSQLDDVNSTLDNKLNNLNTSFNTNLSKLESNLSTLNDKGLVFNADSGNTTRKLGETIEIKGGNKNINTTIENNTLKINISDSPEFTTLNTTGNAKIGGDLTINGTTTAKDLNVTNNTILKNVTLSSGSTFNAGDNKLTNIADGTDNKDAVNKGQLDKVNDDLKANISNLSTNLDKGMNFTGNTGSTNQKAGDTLKIVGDDKNISTNVNKGKVEIKFSDNPTFTTLNTTGDATVGGNLIVNGTATAKDLNVTNNTTLKNVTLSAGSTFDAGNNKLTNVADATTDQDAVNKRQLDKVNTDLTNTLTNLASNLTTLTDKTLTFTGDNGSSERKLGETLEVKGSKNVSTNVTEGKIEIKISDSPEFDNLTIKENLTAKNANISEKLTTNDLAANGNVTLGGKDKKVALESGTTFDAGGNRLTNVSDALEKTDAANLGQVEKLITNATTNATELNTSNLTANNISVNNGTITNLNTTNFTTANGNITNLVSDTANISKLNAEDIVANNGTFNTTLTSKGETKLEGNTTIGGAGKNFNITNGTVVNMGNNKIEGVADGVKATDAVNKGQLDAVSKDLSNLTNNPLTFTGNSGATTRKLGETLNIAGNGTTSGEYSSKNVKTAVTDGKVEIQIAENPEFANLTTTGNAKIGGDLGVNGITTTKELVVKENLTAQTANISEKLTTNDLNATGNVSLGGDGKKVTLGNNTTFDAGGNRLTNVGNATEATDATSLGQVKELITNATTNATNLNTTNLTASNGTITNLTSENGTVTNLTSTNLTTSNGTITNLTSENGTVTNLNSTNLTASNGTITNLTSNTANITQLNAGDIVANNGTFNTTLTSKGETTLSGNTTIGGAGKTFNVANGTTVNMGGNKVEGVADGTNKTDAVNKGQLDAVSENLSNLTNSPLTFTGNSGNTTRKLGETLNISGNGTTSGEYSSKNVKTEVTDGKVEIQIAENPEFANLTTTGNATIGGDLGVTGTTTTKDLVVKDNLTAKTANISEKLTTNDLNATGNVTLGSDGKKVTLGNNTTFDAGGNRLTNVGDAQEKTDATSLGQVQELITNATTNATNLNTTNLTASNGTITNLTSENGTVTNLNTTNLTASNGTITNLTSENGTVTNLNSTNLTAANGNITNLNADDIVANNGIFNTTLTSKGETKLEGNTTIGGAGKNFNITNGTAVNMGDNRVQGVANGTNSTDAVNKGQLDELANKPLSFTGNSGNTTRKLGETLNITGSGTTSGEYSSKNVKTEVTDGKVEIQIAENPEFASLTTTGNATIGGDLGVTGTTTTKDLNVTNSTTIAKDLSVGGNSTVTGNSSVGGDLGVNGTTTTKDLVVKDNLTAKTANISDKLTTNDFNATGNVTLGSDGKKVTLGNNTTFDAGGNRLTNIGNATDATDATSLGQVQELITNATTNATNLNTTNLTASNGTITNLTSENGTVTNLNSTNLTASNGTITNLTSENGTVTNLNSTNLTASNGTITNLTSENGTVTNLNSTNLTASNGNITNLTSENGTVTNLNSTNLTAANGNITNLNAGDIVANNGTFNTTLTSKGETTLSGNTTIGGAGKNFNITQGTVVNMGDNRVQGVANGTNSTDAVNKGQLDELANKPLSFTGNSGNTTRKLGETLNITGSGTTNGEYSSKNVKTEVTDGKVEIQIAENPEFANLTTTGNATIGGDLGVNGTTTTKDLNVTNSTTIAKDLSVGGNSTVTGNSSVGGDLGVNGTTTTKDLNVTNSTTIGKDLSVGGNSTVTGNSSVGGDLGVNGTTTTKDLVVKDNLTAKTANISDKLTTNDFNATGNVTLGSDGKKVTLGNNTTFDAGGNRLTNIGNATDATDATSLGQVQELITNATTNATNLNTTNLTASNGTITNLTSENGTVTNLNSTNLTASNGTITNLTSENGTVTNLNSTNLTASNGTITNLTSENGTVTNLNSTNLTAANGNITNLNAGDIVANNGTFNTTLTSKGETKLEGNTTIGGAGKNFNITHGTVVNMGNNKVEGVANGTNSTDAVNKGQLDELANKPLSFTGNSGNTTRKLGETLNITGSGVTRGEYSSKNVKTVVTDGKVEIQIAENPEFVNLTTTGNATIGGDLGVTGTTTTKDLNVINSTTIAKDLSVGGDLGVNGTTTTKDLVVKENLTAKTANISEKLTTNDLNATGNVTLGSDGKTVTLGNNTTFDAGGNRLTNIGNATDATDATSLGQVQELITNATTNATNLNTTNLTASNGTITNLTSENGTVTNLNSTNLTASNGNITNLTSENGAITNLTSTNLTAENGNISNLVSDNANITKLNAEDIVANNGTFNTTLTSKGETTLSGNTTIGGEGKNLNITHGTTINMGDNRVQGVATGEEDTDAVNVKQLTDTVANSYWSLSNGAVGTGVDETTLTEDEQINPNDQLKLQAGNNLKIKREANGVVTYSTKDDVTFNSVNSSSLNVSGMTTLNALTVNGATRFNNGFSVAGGQTIDMGGNRVQNIADGEQPSDAVNFKQLQSLANSLTEKGLNFSGNEGNTPRNLGETLNIVGNADREGNYSSGNVKTVVTEGKVEVQIAENPEFNDIKANSLTAEKVDVKEVIAESVKADKVNAKDITAKNVTADKIAAKDIAAENITAKNGSFESVMTGDLSVKQNSTINMGNNRVQGVGDAIEDSDAVNLKQLKETNAEVAKGWNITTSASEGKVNGSSLEQMNMGETVTIDAGKNIEITQNGNTISVATTKSANFGGAGESFSLEKGTSVNLGDNVIDGVEDGNIAVGSKQAVNGGQLYKVQQTANAGWNLSVNHSDSSNVKPNDTVDLNNRDSNIQISKNGNEVTFDLAKEINLGEQGSVNAGGVSIGNGSVNVGNVSMNANGVDLGGGKISNIGQGEVSETSNDAVTGSQLYTITSFVNQGWELNTGIVEGSNGVARNSEPAKVGLGNAVSINAGQNIVVTQNGKSIDIATSMTPTFNSLTINQGGTVDMGGNRIQNVAPAIKATDAVNYGQLKSELGRVDSRLRSGIAGAVASASLVQAFNPSESLFAIGGGTYRGASAVSLGYSKVSDNGRVIFKLTGSANNYGDVMGGASIGFKF